MTTLPCLRPLALSLLLLAVVAGVPGPALGLAPAARSAPSALVPGPAGLPDTVAPYVAADPPVATSRRQSSPTPGVWPLHPVPRVVREFEPPLSEYGAGHRGVDLAGRHGQPVRAAAAGRVTYAGLLAGIGVVVVDHGATRTTYQPVRAGVPLGTQVAPGDVIGTLRTPGSHCWPATCLHWGLIEGETYLDPLALVGAGPVRLLPLAGGPGAGRGGP